MVRAEADERTRRGQWKGNLGGQEDNVLSRVELIGRSVEVLRRIHNENEQRKLIIEKLLQQRQATAVPSVLNLPAVSKNERDVVPLLTECFVTVLALTISWKSRS